MTYVYYKNHICFFLSVLKKQTNTSTYIVLYVWRHKDFKAQREDHVITRLPRKNLIHTRAKHVT